MEVEIVEVHPLDLLGDEVKRQGEIEDPWHSRPIDVHRWSDHPEVITIAEQIWNEHFANEVEAGPGPKPKTPFRHQLRVVLLDLYVAWKEDPDLCIGVSMSSNYWDTSSRYNALHISKKVIPIIHKLHEVGLVELARGSYSGPHSGGNRTTRIRASEALQATFAEATFSRDDIQQSDKQEIIILRGPEDKALIEYDDTDAICQMRDDLKQYNEVIASAFIDIPTLNAPLVDNVTTDHHHKLTRRIFSRGDWGCNGRFHGGWWQQINSDWRSKIFINDTPIVEVDFQSQHVSILSHEAGIELIDDPYTVLEDLLPGVPLELQRNLIKKLILTAINARSQKAAYGAFRDGFPANHIGKSLTNKQLDGFLTAFLHQVPHMEDYLFSDQGIRLMNLDSQIAERVLRHFTVQGVPVLSVHDSFIVDYTRVGELKQVMAQVSEVVLGASLKTSNAFIGLDEGVLTDEEIPDYVQWRRDKAPRSVGYLERMREHTVRTGLPVVPFY
jgi:hypothetical protein